MSLLGRFDPQLPHEVWLLPVGGVVRLRLLERLGRGGMGEVWNARATRSSRARGGEADPAERLQGRWSSATPW